MHSPHPDLAYKMRIWQSHSISFGENRCAKVCQSMRFRIEFGCNLDDVAQQRYATAMQSLVTYGRCHRVISHHSQQPTCQRNEQSCVASHCFRVGNCIWEYSIQSKIQSSSLLASSAVGFRWFWQANQPDQNIAWNE